MATLLVGSPHASVRLALRHILERRGDVFELASNSGEFSQALSRGSWDALLIDPSFLAEVMEPLPLVLLAEAPEALPAELQSALLGSLAEGSGLDKLPALLDELVVDDRSSSVRIEAATAAPKSPRIYRSEAWAEVERGIERYAPHDIPVLVLGESGTGKELVARALHESGSRRDQPFVAIHCGALPAGLLESELFGHERGAFTDAHRRKAGRFEEAGSGTLFLDEIGEMSPELQVKLLRAVQERSFTRVGGSGSLQFRARLVAATHRDLPRMVAEGSFREDLLHRLQVGVLRLPPLRERPEDLEPLCAEFLRRCREAYAPQLKGLDAEAWDALQGQSWPGNVRQLENVLRRAAVNTTGPTIGVAALSLVESAVSPDPWTHAIRAELQKRMDSGQSFGAAVAAMQLEVREFPPNFDGEPT